MRTLFDDEPIFAAVDPIRLGQILNNLISNAIKFTDEGEVTIMVRLVSKEAHKALVHFSVKDTGIGIPREFHGTLFKSFQQYQRTNYTNPGTGLGLAIANQLVEAHHSKLFFKSEEGVGSEFFFELSLPIPQEGKIIHPFKQAFGAVSSGVKLTGLNVLVVEDNPVSTLIVKKQLESFGLIPDCVESGKDALEVLFEKNYHTILLDLHLPRMDGFTLSKIIRTQSPDTHIIVFTADIREEIKANFAEIGVNDILLKPFPPQKIFEKLLKVAQDKRVIQIKDS